MLSNSNNTVNDLFQDFIYNVDKRSEIAHEIDIRLLNENFDPIKCNFILTEFFLSQEYGEVGLDQIHEMIKKLFFNGFYLDDANHKKFTQSNFKINVLNNYYSSELQEVNIESYSDFYQNKTIENNYLETFIKTIVDAIDYYDYCLAHDDEFNKKNPLLIKFNGKILAFSVNQFYEILSLNIKIKQPDNEKSFEDYLKKNRIYGRRIKDFKKSVTEQRKILSDIVTLRSSIESQNSRLEYASRSQSQYSSDLFTRPQSIEIPAPNLLSEPITENQKRSNNCFKAFCQTFMSCIWSKNIDATEKNSAIPNSAPQNRSQNPASPQASRSDVMLG